MFAITDNGRRARVCTKNPHNVVSWLPRTRRNVVNDLNKTLDRMNAYWEMVPASPEERAEALMDVARVWVAAAGTPIYHGVMIYIAGDDPLCVTGDDGDYPEFSVRNVRYCVESGMAGRVAAIDLYAKVASKEPPAPPPGIVLAED